MATLTIRIADFVSKAQIRIRGLGGDLLTQFDETRWLSPDAKLNLLKIYETRHFIEAILSDSYGGFTELQVRQGMDFFWLWLDLNTVS